MFYAVIITYFILIFPLGFSTFFNINFEKKKMYFGGYLLGIIKIIKGKFSVEQNRIVYRINNKKDNVKLNDIFSVKTKIKPFNDFHVSDVKTKFVVSNEILKSGTEIFIINYIYNFIVFALNYVKPYLILNNECIYRENVDNKLYFKIHIKFNLIVVIFSVVKIIVGKIYEKRK